MNIKDPFKREAMINDYISTIRLIKKRNLEDRLGSLHHQRELEEHFQPVVKSQEKMTKKNYQEFNTT